MEIIGVRHSTEHVRDAVVDYIDTSYPNLESIMLETPTEHEYMIAHGMMLPWFTPLVDYYYSRGVRIVHGDPKHWNLVNLSTIEVVDLFNSNQQGYENEILKGLLKGRMFRKPGRARNEAMDEVWTNEKPQVTVVGSRHASFIKKLHPEVPYTYFGEKLSAEYLRGYIIYSTRAEKKYFAPQWAFTENSK